MGGVHSTQSQVSNQAIMNKINNISNEKCITSCTSKLSDITVDIQNSVFDGDINIGSYCNIIGASCVLKASLSNDIQNTQKLDQSNNRVDEQDPFSFLSLMMGDYGTQDEVNNQTISNRITNVLNSICENEADESLSGVNIHLVGDTIRGNLNVEAAGTVSNTKCVLDNVVRNTISNDQVATQKNKLVQGSPLLFAIIAVVIIAVIIMFVILILGVGLIGAGTVGGGAYLIHEHNKNASMYSQQSSNPYQQPIYVR